MRGFNFQDNPVQVAVVVATPVSRQGVMILNDILLSSLVCFVFSFNVLMLVVKSPM